MIYVSYDDIVNQYLPWLNDKTHADPPYRLATEAEWEFAARAGGTGNYSLGPDNSNQINTSKANYDGSQTAPVKSFEPNAFGLYNMHGNVSEFTADCFVYDEYQRHKTSGEWLAHKTSDEKPGCSRVQRGGAWYGHPMVVRSAVRSYNKPSGRDQSTSFRIAMTLLP